MTELNIYQQKHVGMGGGGFTQILPKSNKYLNIYINIYLQYYANYIRKFTHLELLNF